MSGYFVSAAAYDRFMGRFSEPLAARFADTLGLQAGQHVLDVGSGPGALTAQLVDRLGAAQVSAVDPSEPFVQALRERLPGVEAEVSGAEQLPFEDGRFDVTAAQLVVHFMRDPVAGLREMGRVTKSGGLVSASVWDQAGGSGPLSPFWDVVRAIDPLEHGEAELPGTRRGQLRALAQQAGLVDIHEDHLTVEVTFASFADWWEPFTLGVGPSGAYVAALNEEGREELRRECAERMPGGAFTLSATAWTVAAAPGPR